MPGLLNGMNGICCFALQTELTDRCVVCSRLTLVFYNCAFGCLQLFQEVGRWIFSHLPLNYNAMLLLTRLTLVSKRIEQSLNRTPPNCYIVAVLHSWTDSGIKPSASSVIISCHLGTGNQIRMIPKRRQQWL